MFYTKSSESEAKVEGVPRTSRSGYDGPLLEVRQVFLPCL